MKKSVILLVSIIFMLFIQPIAFAGEKSETTGVFSNSKDTNIKFFEIFREVFEANEMSFWGSYYSEYNNTKAIFIYLVGDGLTDEQAEIVWGKTVEEIDKETNEKNVVYESKILNDNSTLLLSAVDLDALTDAIKNDIELQGQIIAIVDSNNIKPQELLKIPNIKFSIYSPSQNSYNQIYRNLGIGVSGAGSKPYGYKNDKGMFVHLIGDDLGDSQTQVIWGKKVKDLDKETQNKGVTHALSTLNENPVLLISAVNLDKLIYEINNDEHLKQTIIKFKRAKQVIPSKQIHIPAPEEKMEIDSKKENSDTPTESKVIQIVMEQKTLDLDVPPQMIKGRTLVPLRGIFEQYGAQVIWDSNLQLIKAKKEDITVNLIVGKTSAVINGIDKKLDVPAQIIGGRTLVPLRFISESLGLKVNWDSVQRAVTITSVK